MEKIEYSEETLAQIEQYASIYLKISDMAVLFEREKLPVRLNSSTKKCSWLTSVPLSL